jgi:hypothetical protein
MRAGTYIRTATYIRACTYTDRHTQTGTHRKACTYTQKQTEGTAYGHIELPEGETVDETAVFSEQQALRADEIAGRTPALRRPHGRFQLPNMLR